MDTMSDVVRVHIEVVATNLLCAATAPTSRKRGPAAQRTSSLG